MGRKPGWNLLSDTGRRLDGSLRRYHPSGAGDSLSEARFAHQQCGYTRSGAVVGKSHARRTPGFIQCPLLGRLARLKNEQGRFSGWGVQLFLSCGEGGPEYADVVHVPGVG